MEHAAFEGARYASVCPSSEVTKEAIENKVKEIMPGIDSVTASISGKVVSVTVTKDITIFTYVASTFFGPKYHAVSTVTAAIN